MTYPPTPDQGGTTPPPPDPPIEAYLPPAQSQPHPPAPPQQSGFPAAPGYGDPNGYGQGTAGYGPQSAGYGQAPEPPDYAQGPSPYPIPQPYQPADLTSQQAPGSPYAQATYSPFHPRRATNNMAIAALVLSCAGLAGLCAYGLGGLLGIVGAILGHVARKQIRASGEAGEGLALAGIIMGWIAGGLAAAAFIGLGVLIATDS